MFSILSKIFPSLKIRLLFLTFIMLAFLSGTSFYTTYSSISHEYDSVKVQQISSRYSNLILEYEEELHEEHEDHKSHERQSFNRKAQRELREALGDIDEIFEDSNEWVYLIDPELNKIFSSKTSLDYVLIKPAIAGLKVNESAVTGLSTIQSKKPFIYVATKLSDGNILLLAADHSSKITYMDRYKNRFIAGFFAVVIIGQLLFWLIINSSLKGFLQVRKAADTIAEGDYEYRVDTPRTAGSEVYELASSFNVMIERTFNLLKEIKDVSNNVAHDLRTPITRIRGKMETTLMSNANIDEHREIAGVVIEECDKMMLLIDDILTLAQYESGLIKKKGEEIELKGLLQALSEVFETVAEDRQQKIVLDLDEADLLISGDREKIQRSLSNLLDNALKYSPQKSDVKIAARKESTGISIKFYDSGEGISEEDQARIFERFYRVESSRTTPGNGLGLNLAKAFIENHGGQLEVQSELKKGSCFKVLLPV